MIQITDKGYNLEVEIDMEKFMFSCWEELWTSIKERGLIKRHNIFIREDNKLMKVKFDARDEG